MKKFVLVLMIVLMVLSSFPIGVSFAEGDVKIIIDGEEKTFDSMPKIVSGRTLVPMRGVFEALGMEINWDTVPKPLRVKTHKKK